MPLIECPDCGNRISNRALACPFCGCPSQFFNESKVITDTINKPMPEEQHTESLHNEIEELKEICFYFGNKKISYPESTKNIAFLYGKYCELAREAVEIYTKEYENAGSIYNVLAYLPDGVQKKLYLAAENASKDLYEKGIVIKATDFMEKYGIEFKAEIVDLYRQYEAVDAEKKNIEYKREVEKASRARWQGGGFGMKGAIKGAMNAAILNAGSDLLHAVPDGFSALSDGMHIDSQFDAIYRSQNSLMCFVGGVANSFSYILGGIINELDARKMIDRSIFGGSEDIKSRYEVTIKYETDHDKIVDSVLACIKSAPGTEEYYNIVLDDLFACETDIREFLEFWNLKKLYELLWSRYSTKLCDNPFITEFCEYATKVLKIEEADDGSVVVHGKLIKGKRPEDGRVILLGSAFNTISLVRIIKAETYNVNDYGNNTGLVYRYVLDIKAKESIYDCTYVVDPKTLEVAEYDLIANYYRAFRYNYYDIIKKLDSHRFGICYFMKDSGYCSPRGVSIGATYDQVVKAYGKNHGADLRGLPDDLYIVIVDSSKETEVSNYIENRVVNKVKENLYITARVLTYAISQNYLLQFYFNLENQVFLVAYIKYETFSVWLRSPSGVCLPQYDIRCSSCGKPFNRDSKFCNFCGAPNTLFLKECPVCKKMVNKDVKFCNFCGSVFA